MSNRIIVSLFALLLVVMFIVLPTSASTWNATNISKGATVFIGEQGLNLADTYNPSLYDRIAWFKDSTMVGEQISLSGRNTSFTVTESEFASRTGNWYAADSSTTTISTAGPLAMVVADPKIDIKIWDLDQDKDITGKSITSGERLTFRVSSNAYLITQTGQRKLLTPTWYSDNGNSQYGFDTTGAISATNKTKDGFVNIYVKTGDGVPLTGLWNATVKEPGAVAVPTTGLFVNSADWVWADPTDPHYMYWNTSALDAIGQKFYPAGTYTITAEYDLNKMKDNYPIKTISEPKTITIVSDTVKITTNKDTVTRSKPFSVTITGKPATFYWVWVKGTGQMGGGYDDQPPYFPDNQKDVYLSNLTAGFVPENKQQDIAFDVPHTTLGNGTPIGMHYWAMVKTGTSGTITVALGTSNQTKAQTYTIRVENKTGNTYKTDETNVKVERGTVTITASGDGSYYLGEDVKFSGTNTETASTYLFITGPNLIKAGSQFTTNPRSDPATNGVAANFTKVDVNSDNSWSWKWGTATVALDAGTYTVYAVSAPQDSEHLQDVAYGTVSIIIKKPFISATISQSTVAKGDKVFVRGIAEGKPSSGVAMFVLGKNYVQRKTASVNSDGTFEFELKTSDTSNMASGQYFVVVQHPMQNGIFDINFCADTSKICNLQMAVGNQQIFSILGASSLQGSDAAEALVQAIDSANIDDTYRKLVFLVEEPVIRIDAVGDRHVGDKFQITANTNLAVDDEVLFEVYSSSFKPTQKSQANEFSGYSGAVKVTKGDSGMNKLSFDVNAETFKPDEYIVKATSILLSSTTGSALFNVLEGTAPVTTPAPVVTTVAPTITPVTTAPAVITSTPTKTPTQPGFGAVFALIGLGITGFLVVRKH